MHNVVARLSLGIITAHGFLEVELLSATALWQFWWSAVLHDDLPGRVFLFWWRSFNTWNYYTRTLVTKKGWPKQQSSDWYTESRKQWLLIRASASTGQCCYLVPDSFLSWAKSNEQEFSKQGAQDCFSGEKTVLWSWATHAGLRFHTRLSLILTYFVNITVTVKFQFSFQQ